MPKKIQTMQEKEQEPNELVKFVRRVVPQLNPRDPRYIGPRDSKDGNQSTGGIGDVTGARNRRAEEAADPVRRRKP
jgi:hypothetical protein